MLKNKILLFAVAPLLLVGAWVFWNSAQNGSLTATAQTQESKNAPLGKHAVMEFAEKRSSKNQHEARQQKAFNRLRSATVRPIRENRQITIVTESESWIERLPTLPFAKADLVLRGNVVEANAYLSEDGTTVYSAFSIEPSEVLKGKIESGNTEVIVALRVGGAVRFASGHVQTYVLAGSGAMEPGREYLVFLEWDASLSTYRLLTAAMIDDSKLYPIDMTKDRHKYLGQLYAAIVNTLKTHGIWEEIQ